MFKRRRARVSFPLISIAVAICLMAIGGADNIARAQSSLPPPTGLNAVNGNELGEANLTWDAVEGATYYRVGWLAEEDYRRALSAPNGEWRKEIRYSNIVNRGQPAWTVTRLTPASSTLLPWPATAPFTASRNGQPGQR